MKVETRDVDDDVGEFYMRNVPDNEGLVKAQLTSISQHQGRVDRSNTSVGGTHTSSLCFLFLFFSITRSH